MPNATNYKRKDALSPENRIKMTQNSVSQRRFFSHERPGGALQRLFSATKSKRKEANRLSCQSTPHHSNGELTRKSTNNNNNNNNNNGQNKEHNKVYQAQAQKEGEPEAFRRVEVEQVWSSHSQTRRGRGLWRSIAQSNQG